MADPFLAALDQATRTVVARVRGELPVAPSATVAITHYYCCVPNRALCGLDLSGMPPAGGGEQDCVVCVDLDGDCPLCASGQSAA
ncbi:hypothetical protein ACLQ16_03930 [Streptomyces albidoflavus]|uniref:hypothetical protein n=1 Tax=Streptomyces albidoflavus TaxID=1886 RepID=UPI000A1C99FB|nr:hypothetical protein [Streptomyces albidoflavus]